MPEPIEYQIVTNLQDALQSIRVANGYHFDVAATAVKLDPNQGVEDVIAPDGPRPFIVLEVTPESWQYFPAGQVRIAFPVTVHWVSESTPTDDASRLQTYLRGCADVERAIAVDPTRGNRAADTRIVKRTFETAVDGSQVWAMVEIEMAVHRTYGAPDA